MPNHVTNRLTIDPHDETELRNIKEFMEGPNTHGDDSPISFQQIKPMPEELKYTNTLNQESEEEKKRLELLYGASNWYDWRTKNWGSKWDCYNVQDFGVGSYQFRFDTPWSTPINLIKYLSQKFPTTTFTVEYADEDIGHNCGIYVVTGGNITEEPEPENLDQFACELRGWDYEEWKKECD